MTETLPPLGLDDLRVAEPDRDSGAEFSPAETWWRACDAIEAGHKAGDVAALLLSMDLTDASLLWQWWGDEVREADFHSATREADCPDVLLLAALNAQDVRFWRLPAISGASVVLLRAERDHLRAALLMIHKHAVQGATDPRFAKDQCHEIAEHASKALESSG